MITHEKLIEKVLYDPVTGIFRWKGANGRRADMIGKVAGNKSPAGYIRIYIDGVSYMAHKLAWLYVTGEFPDCIIDHKNMVKDDNSWANLRKASKTENGANSKPRGKSGLKGAYFSKQISRWYSKIGNTYLGTFDTAELAHAAYVKAAQEKYGAFSRAA